MVLVVANAVLILPSRSARAGWRTLATGLTRTSLGVLAGILPAGMTALAFTLLYRTVPNCEVRWRHALSGGVLAAAGFELMKFLFGLYVTAFPSYQLIYGAFAAIPIFLIWIYLSWMVTLVGALVVASLPSVLQPTVMQHNAAP